MTDITNIQIGDEQAHKFARAIYTDVINYVKNHKEEYNKFLNNEKSN